MYVSHYSARGISIPARKLKNKTYLYVYVVKFYVSLYLMYVLIHKYCKTRNCFFILHINSHTFLISMSFRL